MLTHKNICKKDNYFARVLLFVISFSLYHSIVFADIKNKTAEEYRLKGYAEQQKGNFYEALSFYTKASALGLDDPVVLNDMGVLYEKVGMRARAEGYYKKAISVDEQYLPAYTNLAYLYKDEGDSEKAFRYFQYRYENGEDGDPWLDKIKAELLNIQPEYQQHIILAEVKLLSEQVVSQAHDEFFRRVQQAQEYYKQGKNYLTERQYRQAIVEFDKALNLTPQNPKVIEARNKAFIELTKKNIQEHANQAIVQLESGDSASARREVQKMLTTIPNRQILLKQ
ncbi:hypothetical protein MNBD_UNCLBAC01-600 [hydrothermal vent metagenome]|uniref:Tetratricopeptide repeat protein n=1 Tax=hydrothermal vent metagenome TaxID=652676 RepID=A0A3B1DH20_9ZZZZ